MCETGNGGGELNEGGIALGEIVVDGETFPPAMLVSCRPSRSTTGRPRRHLVTTDHEDGRGALKT